MNKLNWESHRSQKPESCYPVITASVQPPPFLRKQLRNVIRLRLYCFHGEGRQCPMKCGQRAEIPKYVTFRATGTPGLSLPPHLKCFKGGNQQHPFHLSPPILNHRASLQLLAYRTTGQHVLGSVFFSTPIIWDFLSTEITLCSLQIYYPRWKRNLFLSNLFV